MVNSESFESDGDRQAKDCATQPNNSANSSHTPIPVSAATFNLREGDFTSQTADGLPVAQAIEPTATKTEYNSSMSSILSDNVHIGPIVKKIIEGEVERDSGLTCVQERALLDTALCSLNWSPSRLLDDKKTDTVSQPEEKSDEKASIFVSVPLSKVNDVLSTVKPTDNSSETSKKISKRLLCLYCDRTFVSSNLRQKHVDRCHSVKQTRRISSRFQVQQSSTGCFLCSALNNKEHSLDDLFTHLSSEHPHNYFSCIQCKERFSSRKVLFQHNTVVHGATTTNPTQPELPTPEDSDTNDFPARISETESAIESSSNAASDKTIPRKTKHRDKSQENVSESESTSTDLNSEDLTNSESSRSERNLRTRRRQRIMPTLRSSKMSIKSTKLGVRRLTRLQSKIVENNVKEQPKKRTKSTKLKANEPSKNNLPKSNNSFFNLEKIFTYKKITDHSIDNLRINSLTFDDVFDKAFFNRIKCNIQDNLQNHIDGKLLENEESDTRISNFEKISPETQPPASENYGSEISVNAATPVPTTILTSQLGEDIESQIEYASKPKKRAPPKIDEVHYKYFTRRKYQASLIANNANRDLSGLDIWTQLIIKNRAQKALDDKKSDKEIQDYANGQEYKVKLQVEELNRILDKRGPFEDLKQEAKKQAALDKLNNSGSYDYIDPHIFSDVKGVVDRLLDSVCKEVDVKQEILEVEDMPQFEIQSDKIEIPSFLNLRRTSSLVNEPDVDQSDRITLICSSRETENFEVTSSKPRNKNELVELTGEWARSRIYVCAACGFKLPNIKLLLEHKNIIHQNVWCQHYEFVGNQSELYRHLSIPSLGKVGFVEDHPKVKNWKRSDARKCTKCKKQCNSLAELHRHILECGEDWTWMLVRKKLKYKPFGSKTRKKRRGKGINIYKYTNCGTIVIYRCIWRTDHYFLKFSLMVENILLIS